VVHIIAKIVPTHIIVYNKMTLDMEINLIDQWIMNHPTIVITSLTLLLIFSISALHEWLIGNTIPLWRRRIPKSRSEAIEEMMIDWDNTKRIVKKMAKIILIIGLLIFIGFGLKLEQRYPWIYY
jgi:hypothetical protein